MKIIIVGCGKVGYAIAQQLTQEKHDITLVDDEAVHLSRADNTLDAMCIHGNGASISVLMEAGAREADLVIAVTGVDETNLVCSLIAKSVGAQHTIARVRNPEYRRDADMLKREIGLDMVINPDLAAAEEIARILSFPAAISVEPFAGGRIDMIGFQMNPDDTILGRTLSDFHRERVAEVLICAAQRGDEFLIPNGAFVPQADDRLYMVGSKAELHKMLKHMGRSLQRVKDVSILGGSRISMYLSWELARAGTRVHIVEQDHDKCLRLSQELPDAMIIEGDGTDNDMIRSENLFGADGFVALTGRDEENLLMALAARRAGVKKVLAKMTRPNYMDLVRDALDYRKWFEFRMFYKRGEETKKPLTNAAFNRFSGGEKAMAMYVPLFAAVNAQYKKAESEDHPRMIALDEAFAGVDDKNIRIMFDLVQKMDFDYIMNSQSLWGCYDTVNGVRFAELYRPMNSQVVTIIRYRWNGHERILDEQ